MKRKSIDLFPLLTANVGECAIEAGVLKVLGILNSKGLATSMSCEGHGERNGSSAWIELNPACFLDYMKKNFHNMERFLKAGEGKWHLNVRYFAKSNFRGLGLPRPRIKKLKRIVVVDISPCIILSGVAREADTGLKTKLMGAMERAAKRYL